jgi:hypothetical protein
VVHLCVLARLCERIGLVDEKNDPSARLAGGALELAGLGNRVLEGRRQQLRHFSDTTLPARRKAQREQDDVNALLPSDSVADGLGELSLARPDIPGEHDERRTAQNGLEQAVHLRVVLARPGLKPGRVDEQRQNLGEPRLLVVEPNEGGKPVTRRKIRVGDPPLEELVDASLGVHHQLRTLLRLSARPPAE